MSKIESKKIDDSPHTKQRKFEYGGLLEIDQSGEAKRHVGGAYSQKTEMHQNQTQYFLFPRKLKNRVSR